MLLFYLEQEQKKQKQREKASNHQKNPKGAGRPPKLSLAEELCLCLFYLRHAPIFRVLGLLFGVSKTTANDIFHRWLDILRELLPASLYEQTTKNGENWEKMAEKLESFCLLIDSTEQGRERPSDNEEQRKYYSGKKKCHTFKSSVISLPGGVDFVDVSSGHRGPASDITLYREHQKNKFPGSQPFEGDKGYVGEENIKTPKKKPKNGELTTQQKAENKTISSSRIFIEHLIGRMKAFRALQNRFRLNPNCYEKVVLAICGLIRLRLRRFRPILNPEKAYLL